MCGLQSQPNTTVTFEFCQLHLLFPLSYFKPLCHYSNLLPHLLFTADKNLNKTALNWQAPLLSSNLSISILALSCPSCPWFFLPPQLWSQSSQSLSPRVKPYLLHGFHSCSVLASSFCWYTSSSLFYIKMLTSLSQQSTVSKYWHVSFHHSQSIYQGILHQMTLHNEFFLIILYQEHERMTRKDENSNR